MPTAWCSLVLLLVVALTWLMWIWRRLHAQGRTAAITTLQRLRPKATRPRTPDACPACRQLLATPTPTTSLRLPVTPWREVKSRRGAPKPIDTAGFACPNRACASYRITDAQVHALVGDGTHRRCERIQTLRCQACGATFSARRDTPLYQLKTASQRVGEVLTALAEGLSVAAAVRAFGHRHATITTWLTHAGQHSATLHDRVRRTSTSHTFSSTNCGRGCGAGRAQCGCGSPLTRSVSSWWCCTWGHGLRTRRTPWCMTSTSGSRPTASPSSPATAYICTSLH
jgi:hypothetical protein